MNISITGGSGLISANSDLAHRVIKPAHHTFSSLNGLEWAGAVICWTVFGASQIVTSFTINNQPNLKIATSIISFQIYE
jgi:hypothetical protein